MGVQWGHGDRLACSNTDCPFTNSSTSTTASSTYFNLDTTTFDWPGTTDIPFETSGYSQTRG